MKYTIKIEDDVTVNEDFLIRLKKRFLDSCAHDGLYLKDKVSIINNNEELCIELSTDTFINKFDILKENLEKIIINKIENKYNLFIQNSEEYVIIFLLNTKTLEKYTIGLEKEEVLYLISAISDLQDEKFDKVYLMIDEFNSAINIFCDDTLAYSSSKSEKYLSKLQSSNISELDNVGLSVIRDSLKLKVIEKGLLNNILKII